MKLIFTVKEIKKFFNILYKLGRGCTDYYPNQACQKSIFVQRVFKKFHKCWMFEYNEPSGFYAVNENNMWDSEEMKFPIIQYISIARIAYYLGYGEEIEVTYFMAGTHKMQVLKIDHNAALRLAGKKITAEKYIKIAQLFYTKEDKKKNILKQN